jgi:hypothetical protein
VRLIQLQVSHAALERRILLQHLQHLFPQPVLGRGTSLILLKSLTDLLNSRANVAIIFSEAVPQRL